MKKINLSDVCEISAGQSAPQKAEYFSEDGYPFVRAGSLEKLIAGNAELEHINDSIGKKLRLRLFPQKTILFAKSGMSAKIGRVYKLQSPSYVVSHLAAIIPDLRKIEPDWLKRWFEFNPPSRLIPNDAYPSIKLSEIARLKIPVIAFEKQKQVSTVLDTADSLRQKRKEQLKLLDDYLKSTFLKMFGELVRKNSEKYLMDDLKANGKGTFSNGPFGSDLLTSELNLTSGIPVVYIRDLRGGEFNWISGVYVSEEKANLLSNCIVLPNDILIAKVGDPPGITAVAPCSLPKAIITQDVIRFRVNKCIAHPLYLKHYINSEIGRHLIESITIDGTRKRFPLSVFKKLEIILPNLKLQNNFASIVEQVEQTKQKMRVSLGEMNNHFNALMQRYFG